MKNIIFDWSGVVKDAVGAQLWITNIIFQKHGIAPISMEEFRDTWEQPYQLFYNKYLPHISLEEEGRDYKTAILSSECPKSKVIPGMVELIKELKNAGHFLAVVSSDHPETLLKEIENYNLGGIFSKVITNVHDKFESVEQLINEQDLIMNETYFIGDSNHETDVAKRLGIHSIAVTWGFCNEKRLKSVSPEFLVHSVNELKSVVL